jgi:hypothetical protein
VQVPPDPLTGPRSGLSPREVKSLPGHLTPPTQSGKETLLPLRAQLNNGALAPCYTDSPTALAKRSTLR